MPMPSDNLSDEPVISKQTECRSMYEVRYEKALPGEKVSSAIVCRYIPGDSFPKQMAGAWRVPDVSGVEPWIRPFVASVDLP